MEKRKKMNELDQNERIEAKDIMDKNETLKGKNGSGTRTKTGMKSRKTEGTSRLSRER